MCGVFMWALATSHHTIHTEIWPQSRTLAGGWRTRGKRPDGTAASSAAEPAPRTGGRAEEEEDEDAAGETAEEKDMAAETTRPPRAPPPESGEAAAAVERPGSSVREVTDNEEGEERALEEDKLAGVVK
jgi:hypothetical protein